MTAALCGEDVRTMSRLVADREQVRRAHLARLRGRANAVGAEPHACDLLALQHQAAELGQALTVVLWYAEQWQAVRACGVPLPGTLPAGSVLPDGQVIGHEMRPDRCCSACLQGYTARVGGTLRLPGEDGTA